MGTEPCQDRSCDDFFYHLCQNDYDTKTFADEFDQIRGLKKRCKSCVDKITKAFDNGLKISSDKDVKKSSNQEVYLLISNKNKPENIHDSDELVIDDDDNNETVDDNEYEDEVVIQENQFINDEDEVIEEEDDDIENRDDIDSDED